MLEKRRSSSLSRLDDGILVVAAIVGVILLFTVIGWIFHTVMFLFKLALAAAVVGVVFRFFAGRRD
jgi:energy-coupling factor transporter transmembrane protein EcfT